MLPRVLEPELMDTAEEARDYDEMDHSAVNRAFVADFLGVSNMMSARGDGGGRVHLGDFQLVAASGDLGARGRIRVVIRP